MSHWRSLPTNLPARLQSLTQLRLKEEKDGKEAVSTCNFTVQALLHLFNGWLSALLHKAAKCLSKPPTSLLFRPCFICSIGGCLHCFIKLQNVSASHQLLSIKVNLMQLSLQQR
jgi:hypothetical protein